MRDPEAAKFLDLLPAEERFATWHLVLREGALVGYGAGGVKLLEAMTLTRRAGGLLARVPGGILDRIYDVVARFRVKLGRFVPDRPGPRRFP